jgi:N-acetylmuramic acid 6-phosphate etherase
MNDTETNSHYDNLEAKSVIEIVTEINNEDAKIASNISSNLPQISNLIHAAAECLKKGGRLFYLGAGTSGRLGILDASECPPTYGVPQGLVVGIIAGGDDAIRKAVEFAEDDTLQGWKDLLNFKITANDFVVGISASGKTPYVWGALKDAQKNGIKTGCIVCNSNSIIAQVSNFPIEVITGPEYVTGSTRMKAGTAQKMILNMISTACMIQIGRVKGNKMVDMQIANNKLIERGVKMIMEATGVTETEAKTLLTNWGSVRKSIEIYIAQKQSS